MSTQAGIWNFDGKPVDRKVIADFSECLKQQGPDGESYYVDGSFAVLYRPFHTTADSWREHQPNCSNRGFVLTWDGRIDNRSDLIVELRNDLRADPTDVAIVTAAFDRWEIDCFRRIVGDWALSIWRPEQRELVLAADYMGIRHIFYHLNHERIWWATDPTPLLLLSGDRFHIDERYIAGYFAHDPDGDSTPCREIREVPPGQLVRVREGKAFVERYWRFSPRSRIRYKSDADYEEHFRHLFRQSVRRRLRSCSPVLAELSGGLDSSSIVCVADDILGNEGALTPRLDTISYYDKTEPNGDDWIYFKKIEEKRGTAGAHIDTSQFGVAPHSLEYPEFAPLPGYVGDRRELEAERAALVQQNGYRVVLSGLGGDEFMGGIPDPRTQLGDLVLQFRLLKLARQLIAWSLAKRRPWIQLLGQSLAALLPAFLGQYFLKQASVEPWVEQSFARRTKLAIRLLDVDEHFGLWLPTRRSCIGGVLLMANKLAKCLPPKLALEETRYPYLDQTLIEFVLSIPATQLLRPGERRSLMRRSLVGIVPADILSRSTKQFGARTPIVALGKNWEELRAIFASPLSASMGYVDPARFMETLGAARSGRIVHIPRLLRGISLELWLRNLTARGLLDSERLLPRPFVTQPLQTNSRITD